MHLMAKTVTDRTDLLALLSETDAPKLPLSPADTVNRPKQPSAPVPPELPTCANARTPVALTQPAQVRGHPRNVRIIPKSRDFH